MKGGFYAADPVAVQQAAECLLLPKDGTPTLFDPCAGKGAALRQIASVLGCPAHALYACELDEVRGRECRGALPGATVLAPCDFLTSGINVGSFSFLWCNPPFDDEIGGGRRVEYSFLCKATALLQRGGVLFLVCPQHTAERKEIMQHMLSWYEEISCWRWPEEVRKYDEVIVAGRRRSRPVEGAKLCWQDNALYHPIQYELPASAGPKRFTKGGFTDLELARAMAASRLRRHLQPPAPAAVPRPGLQLSHGQRALVLAGGFLNRVLHKPGEAPILIKASPGKEEYVKSTTTVENKETEEVKTTRITSEKIMLTVRVLDTAGQIHNLQS